MRIGIYELLKRVEQKTTRQEKIAELQRSQDNPTFLTLLKMSFDPGLTWRLPEGPAPYKPSVDFDQQGMLYNQMKIICRQFIITPQNPRMPETTKERVIVQRKFLDVLESV